MEEQEFPGWIVEDIPREAIVKVFRENAMHAIVEQENGDKRYVLSAVRKLTVQEREILARVVGQFQTSETEAGTAAMYDALKQHCISRLIMLSHEQQGLLLELIRRETRGLSILDYFLEDKELEEIAFVDLNTPIMAYHRSFGWLESTVRFTNPEAVKELVNRMARKLERRLTLHSPRISATLPNGSRLHATIPPVSLNSPTFTIRTFTEQPFTPLELAANNTITLEALGFLWLALELDCSVLIAGNTGSGKTSTLNSLFSFVPSRERIIVTEETPEIMLPHKHVVKLNCAEHLGIGMQELITDTFRMRPDRVVIGEMRTKEECQAFAATMLAGQGRGSYATFHAQSAAECITRLKEMGVPERDLASLDIVVVQKRWSRFNRETRKLREERRITEIAEVILEDDTMRIFPVFSFDFSADKLVRKNLGQRVYERAEHAFLCARNDVHRECAAREQWLRERISQEPCFADFFSAVQQREHA